MVEERSPAAPKPAQVAGDRAEQGGSTPHDREVAGLRCSEVLAGLSDYVDGDLPASAVEQINAHLAGCDWCARFGADFVGGLGSLRPASDAAQSTPVMPDFEALLGQVMRKVSSAQTLHTGRPHDDEL